MKSGNMKAGQSRGGSLARRIHEGVKRFLSVAVSASVIACSIPAIPVMAADKEDVDVVDVLEITMTVDELCDAAQNALREGETISESAYVFAGEAKETYEELFYGADVFEISPEYEAERSGGLSFKTFLKPGGDHELDSAQITGEEEIIFLILNNSRQEVAARIIIDEYETGLITVAPKSDIAAEETDAKETGISTLSASDSGSFAESGSDETVNEEEEEAPEKEAFEEETEVEESEVEESEMEESEMEDSEVEEADEEEPDDTEEAEAEEAEADEADASGDSAADMGSGEDNKEPESGRSSRGGNILRSSLENDEDDDDITEVAEAAVASASDAEKPADAYTLIDGETCEAVVINHSGSGAAYVTSLKELGIDYGISLAKAAYASDADAFKQAIEESEDGDTVFLDNNIEVDCTDSTYVEINTPNITIDLGGNTISVTGDNAGNSLFAVGSVGSFTVRNGLIDGLINGEEALCKAIQSLSTENEITLDNITIQGFTSTTSSTSGTVDVRNGRLSVLDSSFLNNTTRGIYTDNCSEVSIENSVITGNTFSREGGGMCISETKGAVVLRGNIISDNSSTESRINGGGGFFIDDTRGEVTIEGNTVSKNATHGEYGGGGAVYNSVSGLGNVTVKDNKFLNNELDGGYYAYAYGGGFALHDLALSHTDKNEYTFSGNIFDGNKASNSRSQGNGSGRGGGLSVYVADASQEIVIESGEFTNNAADWGGGIEYTNHSGASLTILNALITDNTAQRGGGIWNCPYAITTVYSTFGGAIYGNSADKTGDSIRFEGVDSTYASGSGGVFVSVSSRALGGGLIEWYEDDAGARYQEGAVPVDVSSDRYKDTVLSFSLHGELNGAAADLASEEATTFIAGNTANDVGGGVASNATIDFGDSDRGDMTVTAVKKWVDSEGNVIISDELPTVAVDVTLVRVDEDGNQVDLETVTLDEENEWTHKFIDLPANYTYETREETEVSGYMPQYITETDDDGNETITITNVKFAEPKMSKEVAEDDYVRKDESTEHNDGGEHFVENEDGHGWGTWDDADNNQEITYRLTLTDISQVSGLTVHDYLEEGLDFEPETLVIALHDAGTDTVLAAGTDYEEHEGACSDSDCAMEGCTFEVVLYDSVFEEISSDACIVIEYKALTDTHEEDYTDYEDDILNHSYMTFSVGTLSFRTSVITTETALYGFSIYKFAEENGEKSALSGAEFLLVRNGDYAVFTTEAYKDTGEVTYMLSGWVGDQADADTLVSGADGYIRLKGLDDDTYSLVETKAPNGYEINDAAITVIVEEGGSITVEGDDGGRETVVGHVVNVENLPSEESGPGSETDSPSGGRTGSGSGGSSSGGSGHGGPGFDGGEGDSGESWYPLRPLPQTGDPGVAGALLMMLFGIGALLLTAVFDKKKGFLK